MGGDVFDDVDGAMTCSCGCGNNRGECTICCCC